jgi:WD40 repeat protein
MKPKRVLLFTLLGAAMGNTMVMQAAAQEIDFATDVGKENAGMTSNHGERQVIRLVKEQLRRQSVTTVAWSPDGRTVAATGMSTPLVTLWDSQSLSVRLELEQGTKGGGFNNLAFSPDGRYLASGLRSVNLWEAATGSLYASLIAPHITMGVPRVMGMPQSVDIVSVAFSPDSRQLVVAYGGTKQVVIAYQVADGKLLWSYEPHRTVGGPLLTTPIVFSPDGKLVILGTGEWGGAAVNLKRLARLLFLDATSGSLRKSIEDIHLDSPTALAISRDGKWIATGTSTGVVDQMENLTTHRTVTFDNRDPVRIWDADTGKLVKELPVRSRVWALAFSGDGKYLIGAKSDIQTHHTLVVWDLNSGQVVQEVTANPGPMALATSPDGRRIAAACQNRVAIFEFTAR